EVRGEVCRRVSGMGGIVDASSLEEDSLKAAEGAAKRRGIVLLYMQVRTESDLPKAFASIVGHRASAVMIFGGPYLWGFRAEIATLAQKNALPTIYMYREGPDAGGLMSYGTNLTDAWRRAASYVDKILKGAKAGE